MKLSWSAVVMICIIFGSRFAQGDDWPQYRGPLGDGVSQEKIGEIDWSTKAPNVLWKVPTPLGFSSFSVADGRAFTLIAVEGDDGKKVETCLALDADSGKKLWSVPLGASEYGHDGGNSGAPDNRGGDRYSSPAHIE